MKDRIFRAVKALARLLMRTPLRYFPGARRAYELAYSRLVSQEPYALQCEGSWIFVDPRDLGVSLYLITEGTFEPALTKLFKQLVQPGMTVVDGGANIGYFTLLSAGLVGPRGRVFAFEPEPRNADFLRRSIEKNQFGHVVLTERALSDRDGRAMLFLDRANFGSFSLLKANVADPVDEVEIETITLDGFVAGLADPRIDVIKLDTEGAEGLVLAGAAGVLASGPRCIVMEFSPLRLRNLGTDPHDLIHSMRGFGYSTSVLDSRSGNLEPCLDGELIADCESRDGGHGFGTLVLRR